MVLVGYANAEVEVHLGTGTLTFGPAATYATPVGAQYFPAILDMDGDGVLDIAVGCFVGACTLSFFVGDGAGGFGPRTELVVGGSDICGAVPADLNRDGKMDLLSWQQNDLAVRAVLNTRPDRVDPALAGAEVVEVSQPGSSGVAEDVVVADFDGDGKPDLACATSGMHRVVVALGTGTGGTTPAPGSPLTVAGDPSRLLATDVDADGRLDLVVSSRSSAQVTVLRGTGGGAFAPAPGSPFAVGGEPTALAAGDVNGDGKVDLAVALAGPGSGRVRLFLGAGSGAYTAGATLTGGGIAAPRAVGLGDLDGDGRLDLVVGNQAGSVTVLRGDGAGGFGSGGAPTPTSPTITVGGTGLARLLLADRDW